MLQGIGIHIKVKDFNKSLTFYKSLGFKRVFEYGPTAQVKEDYAGVVFLVGKTKLEIADGHRAVRKDVFKEKVLSSKVSLFVEVDKLSKIIKRCKNLKIKFSVGPRHYYWGTLEAVIKDPDGVVIVFVAPYEVGEASQIEADEEFATKPTSNF